MSFADDEDEAEAGFVGIKVVLLKIVRFGDRCWSWLSAVMDAAAFVPALPANEDDDDVVAMVLLPYLLTAPPAAVL